LLKGVKMDLSRRKSSFARNSLPVIGVALSGYPAGLAPHEGNYGEASQKDREISKWAAAPHWVAN